MSNEKNIIEKTAAMVEVVKQAIELAQKSNDAPVLEKLFDARQLSLDLQEENHSLRKENQKLKDIQEIKKKVYLKCNSYWMLIKNGEEEDGPFCTICLDAKDRLVRLTQRFSSYYECFNCNFEGSIKPVKDPEPFGYRDV